MGHLVKDEQIQSSPSKQPRPVKHRPLNWDALIKQFTIDRILFEKNKRLGLKPPLMEELDQHYEDHIRREREERASDDNDLR